jgi:copper oxidase (laccase) domain-containing protein
VPDAATVWRRGPAGRPHLELAVANQQQLQAAGVRPERILTAGHCTACEADTFFSHRALGFPAGRFAVAAGVRA